MLKLEIDPRTFRVEVNGPTDCSTAVPNLYLGFKNITCPVLKNITLLPEITSKYHNDIIC